MEPMSEEALMQLLEETLQKETLNLPQETQPAIDEPKPNKSETQKLEDLEVPAKETMAENETNKGEKLMNSDGEDKTGAPDAEE